MANDTRYDRHCELWKEHDKQVGRWLVGTILFAIILQHKVLIPFTEIPQQQAILEGRLQEVRHDLQLTQQERQGLLEAQDRLAEIKAIVKQAPWTFERDNLRRSFLDLQRCSEIVRAMPRDKFVVRMKAAAALAGDRQAALLLLPAQMPPMEGDLGLLNNSSPDVRQFPGAGARLASRTGPTPGMLGGPLDVSQFPPVGDLPFANLPFDQTLPNVAAMPSVDQGNTLEVRAILVLALDRDKLQGIETEAQFVACVEDQKRQRGQQLADQTVQRIAEMVDRLVIVPLERLPGDQPEVALLRADVEKWEQDHLGEPQWYQTVPSKGETIGIVGIQATAQTDALFQALERKQRGLEARIAGLGGAELASKQDIEKLDGQRDKLETRMQKLLPEWLQELVSADQMLQVYPLSLVGLLTAIGLLAYRVRSHYLVVRSGHEPPELSRQEPAVSSLWTLVYRGPLATALTAGVYLGAIGINWLYFESGCRLLRSWLPTQTETTSELNRLAMPGTRVLGHLMFFIAAALVMMILLRDRATMLQQCARANTKR